VASAAPSSQLAEPRLLEALGDLLLFEECPAVAAAAARALAAIAASGERAAEAVAAAPNALAALGELLLGAGEPGVQAAATEALASIAQGASSAEAAGRVASLPHLLDALVDVLLVGQGSGVHELASAGAAAALLGSISRRSEAQAQRAAATLGLLQGLADLLAQQGGPATIAAARALAAIAGHGEGLAEQVASRAGVLPLLAQLLGGHNGPQEQACALEALAWISRSGGQDVRAQVASATAGSQQRLAQLLRGSSCGAAGVLAACQSKAAAEALSTGAPLEALVAQLGEGEGEGAVWAALALGAVSEHGGQLAGRVAGAKGCLEALAALAAAGGGAADAHRAAGLALAAVARHAKVRPRACV
jgi:SWI/SNF-related matrix-associated actin-dependent regulator 1 of chromatin subfamily A